MIKKRLWIALAAVSICLAAVFVMGAEKSHRATAGNVIDPTCSSSLPCVEYDNDSFGPGIRGVSLSGNGIGGVTKFSSTSLSNSHAGLFGNDVSSSGIFNAGVRGSSVRGIGVAGLSTSNAGVQGNSTSNNGVFGDSLAPLASGVYGQNDGGGFGVAGRVTKNGNPAVLADAGSTGSNALLAVSAFGSDVLAMTGTGFESIAPFTSAVGAVDLGPGLGVAVSAASEQGIALDGVSGGPNTTLVLVARGTGNLIDALHGARTVMSLDNAGNLHAHSFTADLAASTGQKLVAYEPKTSEPIIEDFGEAQLNNGSAYVRLDQVCEYHGARCNLPGVYCTRG
jgi:hypothetical protein